jgi:hypothetical protein
MSFWERTGVRDVSDAMNRTQYEYVWGNNAARAKLKGRTCVIEAAGTKGTVLLRFIDTGERVTSSRRALRRVE